MDIQATITTITAICSLIISLNAVYQIKKNMDKPKVELQKRVDKHDELLDNDDKRLKEIEEANRMILSSLIVIMNHEATGNGKEKLIEKKDELQDYLIRR